MNLERINLLIEKINHLRNNISKENPDILDLDLMMDYTRVLYADLNELRMYKTIPNHQKNSSTAPVVSEPATEIKSKDSIIIETPILPTIDNEISIDTNVNEPLVKESTIDNSNLNKEPILIDSKITPLIDQKKDIRHFITINDKFLFMSELFKNDKFDYESALDIINNFSDKKSAMSWIQENYFANNIWQENSSTVQTFLSAVDQKF